MKTTILKLLAPSIALLFLFSSCSHENDYAEPESDISDALADHHYFVDQDKAEAIASVLEHPSIDSKTGRILPGPGLTKQVKSTLPIPDKNGLAAYYIMNYKEKGFVILAADERVMPVLAYSERNPFLTEQESYPAGLVQWLAETKDFVEGIRISKKAQSRHHIRESWKMCELQKYAYGNPKGCGGGGGCEDRFETINPIINSLWGQRGLWNYQTPDLVCNGPGGDNNAPTGCLATAMGQIMWFHEAPNTYDWNAMPFNTGSQEAAILMADIGTAVNMNYGCNGSGANTPDEAAPAFRNDFGYSNAVYSDYDRNIVKQNLRLNRPVLLRGGRKGHWFIFPIYEGGHAWVCEGFRSGFFCGSGASYLQLYMNWGWGGQHNGWYQWNNWNPGGDTDFNYKRGMVYNIIP